VKLIHQFYSYFEYSHRRETDWNQRFFEVYSEVEDDF
jgi:hypothetical protein